MFVLAIVNSFFGGPLKEREMNPNFVGTWPNILRQCREKRRKGSLRRMSRKSILWLLLIGTA